MPKIEIESRPHEIVPDVYFGDDGPFEFSAGPTGDVLSAFLIEGTEEEVLRAQLQAKIRWMRRGFHPDDWRHLQDRVDDPEDPLQIRHLLEMYGELVEAVSGRPPTSRSGSVDTPSPSTGAARPRPRTETYGDSPRDESVI